MPVMNGIELVSSLRETDQYRSTPIIMVTSRENKIDREKAMSAGADEYIIKSEFTTEGIINAIDSLVIKKEAQL